MDSRLRGNDGWEPASASHRQAPSPTTATPLKPYAKRERTERPHTSPTGEAGVRGTGSAMKGSWIPACAGMTDGEQLSNSVSHRQRTSPAAATPLKPYAKRERRSVTRAPTGEAGVRGVGLGMKGSWIPACAGMTDGEQLSNSVSHRQRTSPAAATPLKPYAKRERRSVTRAPTGEAGVRGVGLG